jgi:hypothetical protein
MAKSYLDIQNSAYTVGNIMDWTNALTRLSGVPVDITSVYGSYKDAVIYAAENAVAYEGQVISVTENGIATIYVVTPENLGTYTVGEGEAAKNYTVHIKEVGTAPVGDEQSIDVTDGVITLHGFEAAANATLPQKTPVYKMNGEDYVLDENNEKVIDHYEINWVAIDAIVQGDGNTKSVVAAGSSNVTVSSNYNSDSDTYTYSISVAIPEYTDTNTKTVVTAGSSNVTVSSNYDATSDTYTYSVAVAEQEIPDVPEYAIKKLETPSNGSQATYKLTKDGNEVDVAIEIPAFPVITHPEYTIVKEARADDATETRYHLEKDGVEITEDIVVPDAYDDTVISSRLAAVEEFFQTAEGESLDAALDTLIEIQKYIDEDGEVAEQVLANKQAIEVLNGNENTSGSVANAVKTVSSTLSSQIEVISSTLSSQITVVDAKASNAQKAIDDFKVGHSYTDEQVDAKVKTAKDAADAAQQALDTFKIGHSYTDVQVEEAIASQIIAQNLGQYAIASDVQDALDGKQDTITVTEIEHTSDTKTEGVTLTDGKLSIVIDAYAKAETYTKNEVNTAISNKIAEMTGGESAADVLSALNDYKKATDAEIYGAQFVVDSTTTSNEKEIYAPDYTKDSRIDIVTRLASTNSSNLDVLLGTGAGSVAEAKKAGTDAAAAVDALSKGQVTTNKNDIAALATRVGTVESTVGGHTTEIATLTGKVTALEGADTTINTTLGEHTASITALGQKDAELAGLISGNTTAINNEATARTDADNALAARIKVYEDNKDSYATKAEVKVNTDAIAVLNAADTGKSVREIAADEVAKIVGTAPEAFDTLEEVATWIANDTSGAAAMANDIAALKTAVNTTLPAAIATAKSEAIDTAKSEALAEVSTKYVTADTENNLSLNGQTIVLCGGNASSGAASAE